MPKYRIEVTLSEDDPSEVLDWIMELTGDDDASVEELTSPVSKVWEIFTDKDGRAHTRCPHCQQVDMIFEHDTALRWNRLDLSLYPETVVAHLGSSGDWTGDGWICSGCLSTDLESPEDFEVSEWY